jgi:hypothetical protein
VIAARGQECMIFDDPLRFPIVYVDGLTQHLHRWLYRQVIGELDSKDFLIPDCSTPRCVNPQHCEVRRRSRPDRSHCPNGHPYSIEPVTGAYRCLTCRDERNARRRAQYEVNPFFHAARDGGRFVSTGVCARGHELTDDNVYVIHETDRSRVRRRCKACSVRRAVEARDRLRSRRLSEVQGKMDDEAEAFSD